MNYTRDSIENRATDAGFIKDFFEKVVRLTDILKIIYTDIILKDRLVLKGGTAINLLWFNLPRLSVDIDLDYIGSLDKKEMIIERENISKIIISFMTQNNYTLNKRSKRTVSLDSLVFSYNNCFGNKDSIKIEINYMDRCHVLDYNRKTIISPYLNNDFKVLTLDVDELYASKMNALLSRCKVRDLFDVYNMIKFDLIKDINRFKYLYVFYNIVGGTQTPLDFTLEKLNNMHFYEFKKQLKPYLTKKDDFNVEEAKEIVSKWIIENIKDDDAIKMFIESFNNGIFNPEIMFNNYKHNKNIVDHPMAKWRISGILKSKQ